MKPTILLPAMDKLSGRLCSDFRLKRSKIVNPNLLITKLTKALNGDESSILVINHINCHRHTFFFYIVS